MVLDISNRRGARPYILVGRPIGTYFETEDEPGEREITLSRSGPPSVNSSSAFGSKPVRTISSPSIRRTKQERSLVSGTYGTRKQWAICCPVRMGPHEDGENRDSRAVMNMSPADPGMRVSSDGAPTSERSERESLAPAQMKRRNPMAVTIGAPPREVGSRYIFAGAQNGSHL